MASLVGNVFTEEQRKDKVQGCRDEQYQSQVRIQVLESNEVSIKRERDGKREDVQQRGRTRERLIGCPWLERKKGNEKSERGRAKRSRRPCSPGAFPGSLLYVEADLTGRAQREVTAQMSFPIREGG